MMYILSIILLLAAAIWLRQRWSPVDSLTCPKVTLAEHLSWLPSTVKLLDIRDVTDFDQGHIPGSINISLGRLPFVWQKELSPDDEIVILADSCLKSKKAARILYRKHFKKLHTVRTPIFKQL
ncbi:rhodanese-like domain-containing protein [Paenibacillus dauci]|uniref:rhodanese-like domain-containing protein n=1 Tax=Paenibacillus dauci TaxID=1567106 RepID=UPI0009E1C09F|nr:rhodanese-like domain-containing protein [Paenibacillus dauci]